ncbi:hypothetical protein F5Y08DRAFT_309300 [Xylaria arbuscula]|nr:hypothetical protein F5Y08DRAFT_309300 [Xylaria arbuscula]
MCHVVIVILAQRGLGCLLSQSIQVSLVDSSYDPVDTQIEVQYELGLGYHYRLIYIIFAQRAYFELKSGPRQLE